MTIKELAAKNNAPAKELAALVGLVLARCDEYTLAEGAPRVKDLSDASAKDIIKRAMQSVKADIERGAITCLGK